MSLGTPVDDTGAENHAGSASAETAEQVVESWEAIKRQEKKAVGSEPPRSLLDGLPAGLPALLRAERLGGEAARVGFDWEQPGQVLGKVGG